MPTCKQCGFVVLGTASTCGKCGSPVRDALSSARASSSVESAPSARPGGGRHDLEQAVQEVADPATPASPASDAPRSRRVGLLLLLAALLGGGWYAWCVVSDAGTIPLAEGNAWTFSVNGDRAHTITLRLGATATLEGVEGRAVDCTEERDGQSRVLGKGWVTRRTFGLDLLSIEGMMGTHPVGARMLPFPYGPGSSWRSRLGYMWQDSGWRAEFMAGREWESVQTPAGTWPSLRVGFQVLSGGTSIASGEYWVARGVGPVRVRLAQGSRTSGMTLELVGRQ